MGVFTITGTVVAIGQSTFDNRDTLYAFVEIVEPSGRRVMVQNVAAGNQVLSTLSLGATGEFFFDKFFVGGGCVFVSQLWGAKTRDGLVAFDDKSMRKYFVTRNLILGFIGSLFILGIPLFILGLIQLIPLILVTGSREQLFYGNDCVEAKRLHQQQAVRM